MDKKSKRIIGIFANSKRRKLLTALSSLMVVAVAFLTLHFLILPAVTMEKTPICGLEEHTHTEECYKEERVLVCNLEENEEHTHTEDCYKVQKTLICGKQEHVHTSECFEQSDPKADREDEKTWKGSISEAKLSKNWADDVAAIASTQLDYEESDKNFVWNENGDKMGYTRYGDWFGNKYADWSNMFVAFCLNYANVPYETVPYRAPVSKWTEQMKKNGTFEKPEGADPHKGDILFLDKNEDGKVDTAAIVSEVEGKKDKIEVKAIEGNVKDKVKKQKYSLKDKEVKGFGKLSQAQSFTLDNAETFSTTQKGTYYKQVTSFSELANRDTVLIVSVEGNYALTNNKGNTNYTNKTKVTVNPVKGNPGYYTVDGVKNTVRWTYMASPRSINNSSYRLDNRYTSNLFVGSNSAYTLDFKSSDTPGCWTLSTYDSYNGYRYYLNNNGNTFLGSYYEFLFSDHYQYARTDDMIILKEVNTTLTIPEDAKPRQDIGGQPGSAQKPDYPAYIETSNETSGNKKLLGADCEYKSDPSTSQIESKFGYHELGHGKLDFDAQSVDDGKTLTDKSVIFGKDDYNAFAGYAEDEFSVTLSALGQTFNASTTEERIPLDVLFILDLSGSMNNIYGDQQKPRAEILVESMNKTIDNILKANPENRVCAVGYNSNVTELLELGRPKKNSQNQYFKFIRRTSGDFYVEHQINIVDTNQTVTCQHGTYTQLGIAKGIEMLKRNKDTTVNVTIHGERVEIPRQPVVILVSDGEPTHCTNHYMDVVNAPYYGDGIGDVQTVNKERAVVNAQGVLGYYTILSANYYKREAGNHYNNPATMYTVAFGMNELDTGHAGASAATKHYCSTVMHPTRKNIDYLNTINQNQAVHTFAPQIEGMLYSLLKGTHNGNPVKIGASYDLVHNRSPHANVPIILNNPYRSNYNYSDKAFLGNEGVAGLDAAFNEILNINSIKILENKYETLNHKPIVITDPIGDGMQLNGDPVLRINGRNYQPTAKRTSGGVQYFDYKYGLVPMDNYSSQKINLDKIEVSVTTDASSKQTVKLSIPDNVLPVYTADNTLSFYYEALPLRLIYKVGLSESAKTQVENLAPGQSLTYYTNSYQNSEHAKSNFAPASKNGYYKKYGWKQNINKINNTTGTDTHSLIADGTSTNVNHSLGNNGKLVFTKPAPKKTISVEKKWLDYGGENMTENLPESITATLYRTYLGPDGKTVKEDVLEFTLSKENSWKKTFTYDELKEKADIEYKYYVKENELSDFKVFYEGDGISQNTEETPIIITNRYKFGAIMLPSTGGPGTVMMSAAGVILMLSALGYGYVLIRKKRRG